MLTEERQREIVKIVEEKEAVTVIELVQLLNTSESTIRRDLTVLDKQKRLKKVHGGATKFQQEFLKMEYDVPTKVNFHQEEKDKIARYVANMIENDDMIFLDAGTTTERVIDYLTETHATFVTNGIIHASKLMKKGIKTIILGGELKDRTEAVIGVEAVENLKKYNFTKCFLGVNGISIEGGFTTPTAEESYVKTMAIERSFASYVLADHSKFSMTTAFTFAKLQDAIIITNKKPLPIYCEKAVIREVEL